MTSERWDQISEIFSAILELHPSKREAYLDQACAGDAELRNEVENLLARNEQASKEKFLEERAPWIPFKQRDGEMVGRRIGPYQIVKFLGGGDVYLAVRVEPFKKRVAIKFIKPALDTEEILRRFKSEMQIHAALSEHPNIAGLLDAGSTEDGRPYFVMEYVEGQRIDQYCDTRKLTIRDRVDLFRSVLAAVQYAHQNVIIHLDLKPSNILVTQEGVPKLVDFGIARLVNPDLADQTSTLTGSEGLTREYASPEQVRGDALITTASDVYSLGVILYELLTGHRPYTFETRSEEEIQTIVCEENPENPGTVIDSEATVRQNGTMRTLTPEDISQRRGCQPGQLRRLLSKELGIIPLIAMRKEPQRRYPSVVQFSEDLLHWLNREPLEYPHGPTSLERFGRWCQRMPLVVGLGLTAGVLLALADIGASLSRLHERISQVHKSNVFAAQSVASTVHERMQHLSSAVARASIDGELQRLLELYNGSGWKESDRQKLQVLVGRFQDDYDSNSGFMWSAENPFVTWFVLDTRGTVLAHSQDSVVDANFGWRDYLERALDMGKTSQNPSAGIGRVYKAYKTEEKLYKFPVFTPIRSEKESDRVLGVLVATVPTESTVGTLLQNDAQLKAVLVGRGDRSQPSDPDAPLPSENLIVGHPTFHRGDEAVPIDHEMLLEVREHRVVPLEAIDDNYQDPVANQLYRDGDPIYLDYKGRWLAAFAPVENTEFVVIVQQRYDKAVAPERILTRVLILWGGIALSIVVGGSFVWYSVRHSKRRRWRALQL